MDIEIAKKVAVAIMDDVQQAVSNEEAGEKIYQGADGEPTYRIDDIAEKAAFRILEDEPVAVLSEEAGFVFLDKSPEYICILDPLDGSTNAVSGIPFYCTSVALAPWSDDACLRDVGVGVVANLVTGEIFEGEKGKGVTLNGRSISGSSEYSPKHSTASLYLKSGYQIISAFSKVRAMGAVALELAHVASGSLECLLDNRMRLKVTDVAAGMLLIDEAGGVVTDLYGNDLNQSITRLDRVSIVAVGNLKLHDAVIKEYSRQSGAI